MFASGADLQSINPLVTVHPLAKQAQRYLLLMTLARYDSALVPEPYLARAWAWSADGRALTFNLRTSVPWHDGRPTTAKDVVWTLEAARDPATGYPRLNDLALVREIIAPDESTVVVRFSEPLAQFPDVLTDLAILPAHLLERVPHAMFRQADWNRHPVGNGPFKFVTHEPNRRWVFEANHAFPLEVGGPPALERFVIAVVDEPTTKLAALASGELDFAGIQPAHAQFVRRDPSLAVLDYPLLLTYGIVFNTRRPPFNEFENRRALSSALNRKEIVDGYLYGFGKEAFGPVPPELEARLPSLPMAGGKAGELHHASTTPKWQGSVDFELLTVGSGEAALEQMVQAQLAPAGFRATIRQLELSAYLDRTYGHRHEFQAAVLGISGDVGLGYLEPLARLAGAEYAGDPEATLRLFADSLPVAFLYHARGVQGMNRRVKGVRMDIRGELATVLEWRVEP